MEAGRDRISSNRKSNNRRHGGMERTQSAEQSRDKRHPNHERLQRKISPSAGWTEVARVVTNSTGEVRWLTTPQKAQNSKGMGDGRDTEGRANKGGRARGEEIRANHKAGNNGSVTGRSGHRKIGNVGRNGKASNASTRSTEHQQHHEQDANNVGESSDNQAGSQK
jgi:hypothetical protein